MKNERLTTESAVTCCGTHCELCNLPTDKVVAAMNSKTRWGCIKMGCPIMHFRSEDWKDTKATAPEGRTQ